MFGISPIFLILVVCAVAVGWLVVAFNDSLRLAPGWRTPMRRSMCN